MSSSLRPLRDFCGLGEAFQPAQKILIVIRFADEHVQTIDAFIIRRMIKGDTPLAGILAKHDFVPMNRMNFGSEPRNGSAAKIGASRFRGRENSVFYFVFL